MRLFMFLASILGNGFYAGSIYSVKSCLLLYILNLLPHNFSKCPLDLKLEKMKNPSPFIQFAWFMIVQISPTCSPAVILSQTEKSQVSQSLSLPPQLVSCLWSPLPSFFVPFQILLYTSSDWEKQSCAQYQWYGCIICTVPKWCTWYYFLIITNYLSLS